ncbi:MAG: hypothetical protein ABIY70_08465 [Capsulimonas sp.]|uniref:hypothetical protein n=1 Tax=Capsulimonas sp. TaxID=2494211 RepID=UPI003263F28D
MCIVQPLRTAFRSLILLAVCCVICLPASAAVIATENSSERTVLKRLFKQAKQSICIRCSRLEDPVLLSSLLRAGRRGVDVRVIAGVMTPDLQRAARRHSPHFAVRMAAISDNDRESSQAIVDKVITWYGGADWSPKKWRAKSQYIIDGGYRNGFPGTIKFERLWRRSKPIANPHSLDFSEKVVK